MSFLASWLNNVRHVMVLLKAVIKSASTAVILLNKSLRPPPIIKNQRIDLIKRRISFRCDTDRTEAKRWGKIWWLPAVGDGCHHNAKPHIPRLHVYWDKFMFRNFISYVHRTNLILKLSVCPGSKFRSLCNPDLLISVCLHRLLIYVLAFA